MKTARGSKKRRSSKTVQPGEISRGRTDTLERDCTDSAIDESVQRGAVEVQVQVFRAKMKAYLEGEAVVILGNSWHCRGIVIPVARTWYRTEEDRKQHHMHMRAQFEAAIQRLNN